MPNPQNLIPNSERTPTYRHERAVKMGKASAKARAQKRTFREAVSQFMSMKARDLNLDVTDIPPEMRDTITVQDLMILKQLIKATDVQYEYDTKSFTELRDTAGEKPVSVIQADVQTTNVEDVTLDDALTLARQIKSEKPKSRKKSE